MRIRSVVKLVVVILVFLFTAIGAFAEIKEPNEGKKYVFIDAGAQDGVSLLAFQKTPLFKAHPWEIIAIEADSSYIPLLSSFPGVSRVISQAMWIYDGYIDFYVSKTLEGGCLWSEGHYASDVKTIKTECFDFGKWLASNYRKEDYVIVSMDIDGSEYQILDKMVKDGSIEYIDELFVEFSDSDDFKDFSSVAKGANIKKLVKTLQKKGIIKGMDSVEDCFKDGQWVVGCGSYPEVE